MLPASAGSAPVTQPNSFSAAAGVPEGVETDIFLISSTGEITVRWVNADGCASTFPTHSALPLTLNFAAAHTFPILYVPASNAFAITGDAAAFGANFGDANAAVSFRDAYVFYLC